MRILSRGKRRGENSEDFIGSMDYCISARVNFKHAQQSFLNVSTLAVNHTKKFSLMSMTMYIRII